MMDDIPLLIVENDPVDILLFKRALTDLNYRLPLVVKESAQEATDHLRLSTNVMPWLIFLDLNLPKDSGLIFLEQLKSATPFKWIPVIVVTSSENPDDILKAALKGCCGYLLKAYEFSDFKKSVGAALEYWSRCLTPARTTPINWSSDLNQGDK